MAIHPTVVSHNTQRAGDHALRMKSARRHCSSASMHTSSLVYPQSVSEVAIAVVSSRSASPVSTVLVSSLLML